jgi:hypothetical protein
MNEVFVHKEITRIENRYLYSTDEPEPSYEEKLNALGERELTRILVKSGMEVIVLELIIKKLTARYNEIIKRRAEYNAVSEALLKSKSLEEYEKGIQLKGECKAINEEIADFLIENCDSNYDYAPALRELVRFNSIEV